VDRTLVDAPLLAGIDVGDVRALTRQLRPIEFPCGHVFFGEDQPGDELFFILSGKVKLCRRAADGREMLFGVLGPPDMFGELSVFDPGPRTSTAIAVTKVCVAPLDREVLKQWIAARPAIAERLMRVLARRLRRIDSDLSYFISTDVTARIAMQLLRLAKQFGIQEDGAIRVTHDLTQEELGQLVGASRETINKVLSELCRHGCIRLEGKSVMIIDSEELTRRAQ
jgi:CRP/FNR family cyclic AMP-dependent transcriptional regulator